LTQTGQQSAVIKVAKTYAEVPMMQMSMKDGIRKFVNKEKYAIKRIKPTT